MSKLVETSLQHNWHHANLSKHTGVVITNDTTSFSRRLTPKVSLIREPSRRSLMKFAFSYIFRARPCWIRWCKDARATIKEIFPHRDTAPHHLHPSPPSRPLALESLMVVVVDRKGGNGRERATGGGWRWWWWWWQRRWWWWYWRKVVSGRWRARIVVRKAVRSPRAATTTGRRSFWERAPKFAGGFAVELSSD